MSINRVNISGNLTRDAELRATQGGTSILRFGVAVNDRRQNPSTGEWEDRPNFVDCVVFGKRADALSDILRKGIKVAVEGKLRYSSWQTDDGSKRSKLEVVVDEVELMTVRDQARQQGGGRVAGPQQAYPQHVADPYATPVPQQAAYAPQQAAYAPQGPQAATGATYPATTPQAAPQRPVAYQQQIPTMPVPQAPAMEVYDEDIPF